jgi:Icc-related predicted phosphoesterase
MIILAVSDHEQRRLYDAFDAERWVGKIDLAISCGDLRPGYLSFLVTMLETPLLYVAGNHDARYRTDPPEGCDDVDGRLVTHGALRIGGIAGCLRYNAGADEYQFSERQMRWRVRRLATAVWRAGGVDIMVSHAAPIRCPFTPHRCPHPAGAGKPCIHPEIEEHPDICPEALDPAHRSVPAFNQAIARWKPRLWLHGHNHLEYGRGPRLWWLGETQVINADGHVIIDTERIIDRTRGSILSAL